MAVVKSLSTTFCNMVFDWTLVSCLQLANMAEISKLQNILAMLKPVLLKVMQKTRLQLGSLMRLIIADWCSHNNLKRKAKVEYM